MHGKGISFPRTPRPRQRTQRQPQAAGSRKDGRSTTTTSTTTNIATTTRSNTTPAIDRRFAALPSDRLPAFTAALSLFSPLEFLVSPARRRRAQQPPPPREFPQATPTARHLFSQHCLSFAAFHHGAGVSHAAADALGMPVWAAERAMHRLHVLQREAATRARELVTQEWRGAWWEEPAAAEEGLRRAVAGLARVAGEGPWALLSESELCELSDDGAAAVMAGADADDGGWRLWYDGGGREEEAGWVDLEGPSSGWSAATRGFVVAVADKAWMVEGGAYASNEAAGRAYLRNAHRQMARATERKKYPGCGGGGGGQPAARGAASTDVRFVREARKTNRKGKSSEDVLRSYLDERMLGF
ncbi:hypothetical protein DFJ73DRAFT_846324 [Zopfochytrium polystomum]|nr:hypothetical protein DFJ73DRAFT_846324 [Zopfochytrium polystomum]